MTCTHAWIPLNYADQPVSFPPTGPSRRHTPLIGHLDEGRSRDFRNRVQGGMRKLEVFEPHGKGLCIVETKGCAFHDVFSARSSRTGVGEEDACWVGGGTGGWTVGRSDATNSEPVDVITKRRKSNNSRSVRCDVRKQSELEIGVGARRGRSPSVTLHGAYGSSAPTERTGVLMSCEHLRIAKAANDVGAIERVDFGASCCVERVKAHWTFDGWC